jgi:hypothetical protein
MPVRWAVELSSLDAMPGWLPPRPTIEPRLSPRDFVAVHPPRTVRGRTSRGTAIKAGVRRMKGL